MNTYIALLRGINVGGKNILPMAELVNVFEGLGLSTIKTYIQSGNVVFQSKTLGLAELLQHIPAAIKERFSFDVQVIILDVDQLKHAIALNPFPGAEAESNTLHYFFLAALPNNLDLQALERLKAEREQFRLINQVFYLYAPDGIGRSKLAMGAEKKLGVAVTARNWRTVNKLMELANSCVES